MSRPGPVVPDAVKLRGSRNLAQVTAEGPLQVAIVEDRGGMVRRLDGHAPELKRPVPGFLEAQPWAYQPAKGRRSEGDNDPRLHRTNLRQEVESTGVPLVRFRLAVPRRSTFHDVCDEDGIPSEAGGIEGPIQDPPRSADKWPAGEILVLAGSLPDQEDGRLGGPFAGHGNGPGPVEPAPRAATNGGRCGRENGSRFATR